MTNSSTLPGHAVLQQGRCIVCSAGQDQQQAVFQKWGYTIQKCRRCGLGTTVIDPGFNPTTIYDEGYFQGKQRDGYSDYVGSENVLRKEFRHSLADLRRYGISQGSLLEIGSAYGFFLAEASKYFECMGIEISQAAVDFGRSRGLNVQWGALDETILTSQNKFNAAVMLDVIEHLPNPGQTLDLIWKMLDANGGLMISTGDWSSLLARVMGKQWRLMTPPQHLYFFTTKALIQLLTAHGFEVVHLAKPWKTVAVGLIAYQMGSRLSHRLPVLEGIQVGIPVNLFDAIRLVARKVDDG